MERGQVNLEIETLLSSTNHGGVRDQDLLSVFKPQAVEDHHHAWEEWSSLGKVNARGPSSPSKPAQKKDARRVENVVWRKWFCEQLKRQSSEENQSGNEEDEEDRVVRGSDIGDAPTVYTAKRLHGHEMPVIGTYVDKRIMTGWKYQVRALGNGQKYFGGRALTLQSIGMGYGKRLTFRGDKLNENENYFWSDSQSEGYGFSVVVLTEGTTFQLYDDDERHIGTAFVEAVSPSQVELSTTVGEDGCITKKLAVTFECFVQYGADPHGVLSLVSQQQLQVTGVAISKRAKRAAMATLMLVNAALPNYGPCVFYPEDV